MAGALAGGIGAEQVGQLPGERGAPRETGRDYLADRPPGVHAPGVDLRARRRPRCALPGIPQAVVRAQHVQDVRGIGRVEDGELRRQRERLRVLTDDLVGDGVERPAADPLGPGDRTVPAGRGAGEHVAGRAAGERQQQDPASLHTLAAAQPGRPRDQRPRFAGTRPGQHQQRATLVCHRAPLLLVQPAQNVTFVEHGYEHNQIRRHKPYAAPGRPSRRWRTGGSGGALAG